ncbi:hypothetical protein VOLCADRAFT_96803 [Volvox carteri f. nagariensis]|uniref:Uncharacterized protein n=1 Tax=Volvox carteri f. nagariensis TaxID=3068 RepID=D8UB37_VOLCA|nr:uncharacterized protein VOLCADRAFT_96803 [Volvox carteri f. nagariensis]EFJ43040.1 hypothetical protein VOLCADRAFT_96803 [Volvox carteri f. nagariensis]|eukprot:XP_002955839.1 hypothetical protein VOLCADRAFT_96803 [Volvox carteri f. nagariensis]
MVTRYAKKRTSFMSASYTAIPKLVPCCSCSRRLRRWLPRLWCRVAPGGGSGAGGEICRTMLTQITNGPNLITSRVPGWGDGGGPARGGSSTAAAAVSCGFGAVPDRPGTAASVAHRR